MPIADSTRSVLVVNANPLLNLVHTGTYKQGTINRVASMAMHAEGKGVNVARILARLGHRVTLTGFAGGHSGAWLRDLILAEGIKDAFLCNDAPIRVGFMASNPQADHPTTVLPAGFSVTSSECEALANRVRERLDNMSLLIISGSVPHSNANDLYRILLEHSQQLGIPCWLDAHGPALRQALGGNVPPDLAKPNLSEYGQSDNWDQVAELHITDGEQPVEVRSHQEGLWRITPPSIRQVNPVGCGDCYLAGLAHGWLQGLPFVERLKLASAAGAANALRPDVAMIDWGGIECLLDRVVVEPA